MGRTRGGQAALVDLERYLADTYPADTWTDPAGRSGNGWPRRTLASPAPTRTAAPDITYYRLSATSDGGYPLQHKGFRFLCQESWIRRSAHRHRKPSHVPGTRGETGGCG